MARGRKEGVSVGTYNVKHKKERFCGVRYCKEDKEIILKALDLCEEDSLSFVRDAVLKKAARKIKQFTKNKGE